jgi:hypothetical protein
MKRNAHDTSVRMAKPLVGASLTHLDESQALDASNYLMRLEHGHP